MNDPKPPLKRFLVRIVYNNQVYKYKKIARTGPEAAKLAIDQFCSDLHLPKGTKPDHVIPKEIEK
ncbi:MAG TPA: hypothetical protein PK367_03090 [Candidatus Paceibacterota bacterium]|nr:hypothetical protein [Candidatus Paceibacterota bacterium]